MISKEPENPRRNDQGTRSSSSKKGGKNLIHGRLRVKVTLVKNSYAVYVKKTKTQVRAEAGIFADLL